MYLARLIRNNRISYRLRESFPQGGFYRNRDLLDLGEDPGKFIVYPGGSSFYIDDVIIERLEEAGVAADYDTVESLFLPFLDPEIRERLEPLHDRVKSREWTRTDQQTGQLILDTTHVFDKRRIHYLRFGQTDQRDLDRSPALFKILLDKSRDELEQLISDLERKLSPDEYKTYTFTIFDLQRYFGGELPRSMPYALNRYLLDDCFIKELCRLDCDQRFWQGLDRASDQFSYLVRYVIMFFDYSFPREFSGTGASRGFSGADRQPGAKEEHMSEEDVSGIFGVGQAELAAMSKAELTRLYRKRAQELHPDKGGEHERFIALTAAYNELLRSRSA